MKKQVLLKMVNVSKWFDNLCALKNINFTLNYNEIVALVGDNGAGKSTLIKILSGIHQPSEGEIYIKGEKVNPLTPRKSMEYGIETIHQDTMLVNGMTIARNFFLGKEPLKHFRLNKLLKWIDLDKMGKESIKALKELGLHISSPNLTPTELSGGEKKGIVVTRSVYFKSQILILDEPLNNLSVKESRNILKITRDLPKHNISAIIIGHNIPEIYETADRIVLLRLGEVIADVNIKDVSLKELEDKIAF